jgi:plastocyanin
MKLRTGASAIACAAIGLAILPAAAAAKTRTVYAGGPGKFAASLQKKYGAGVNNFLINRVTINVGDTVVWNGKSLANGFHTVDFPGKAKEDLALFVPGATVTGVDDFAGNPFWFNGKVPSLGFNPSLFKRSGPATYNGSKRADSGLPLGKPTNFKLKFTKPGVYKYFCDVHYGMVGYVVVKKDGVKVPSTKQNAKELSKEEARLTKTAKRVDKTKVTGDNVSLGASGPGGVEVFAMFPSTLTVKAGTTVKFAMSARTREVHTASFGPKAYLNSLANSLAGPAPSPAALYPSDPPGTGVETSSSHGNGFSSTGALDRDSSTPPIPPSNEIKFTQAGTYHFICLIHPFMHGTIVVTP